MNELSWLLYFATVSGTLKVLFFMGAGGMRDRVHHPDDRLGVHP